MENYGGRGAPREIASLIANRYRVSSFLGSGAMGSVVCVRDSALNDEILALKILHPELVREQTVFERFKNEVIVTRRLAHPNIVRLYDFGQALGGYYFITMEYVDGPNLETWIKENAAKVPDFREICRIFLQIVEGVFYAHCQKIVHRDLKPANILLAKNGEVKITDFGLARTLSQDNSWKNTSALVGTPLYMAPEQIRGESIDERCDIYALGIIAYELVLGVRPFNEEAYLELAAADLIQAVAEAPMRSARVPAWYCDLVQKCTARCREKRFQAVEEIKKLLYLHLHDTPPAIRLPSSSIKAHYSAIKEAKNSHHKQKRQLSLIYPSVSLLSLLLCLFILFGGRVGQASRTFQQTLLQVQEKLGIQLFIKQKTPAEIQTTTVVDQPGKKEAQRAVEGSLGQQRDDRKISAETQVEDGATVIEQNSASHAHVALSAEVQKVPAEPAVPLTAIVVQAATEALPAPPPVKQKPSTILRLIGRPDSDWVRQGANLFLKRVSVVVKNIGNVEAKEIRLDLRLPGGKVLSLNGPASCSPKSTALYYADANERINKDGRLETLLSCANCRLQ